MLTVKLSLLLTVSQDRFAALHVAYQEGHTQVAELLLQAGASVDQETEVSWDVGPNCHAQQCTYIGGV